MVTKAAAVTGSTFVTWWLMIFILFAGPFVAKAAELTTVSGNWVFADGMYTVDSRTANAIALAGDTRPVVGASYGTTFISRTPGSSYNAFLVFDYQSPTDFKYVGARVGGNSWMIGHFDGAWKTDTSIGGTFTTNQPYTFRVDFINEQTVGLVTNNETLKIFTFSDVVTDGVMGYALEKAHSSFSPIVRTNKVLFTLPKLTNTGLDQLVTTVISDNGLQKKISLDDLSDGAAAAASMNKIIVDAIKAAGVVQDKTINSVDVLLLQKFIHDNQYEAWFELHGDDEDGEETGFHLVQNDGAITQLYGKNAVNTVADGIYHLGLETNGVDRLKNEDGNNNATFSDLSLWLNGLLKDDLSNDRLVLQRRNTTLTPVLGDWSEQWGEYSAYSKDTNIVGLLPKELPNGGGVLECYMRGENISLMSNGFIMFDYKDKNNFKFAGNRIGAGLWVIGEMVNGVWLNRSSVADTIDKDKLYKIQVVVTDGGKTTLSVNGQKKLSYDFGVAIRNRQLGFAAEKTYVSFSTFTVKPLLLTAPAFSVSTNVTGTGKQVQTKQSTVRR